MLSLVWTHGFCMNSLNQINVSEVKCEVVFRDEVQVKHLICFPKKMQKMLYLSYLWFCGFGFCFCF